MTGNVLLETRELEARREESMVGMARSLVCAVVVGLIAVGASAASVVDDIDSVMEDIARLDLFSGTVLVAKDGGVVYARAFGEADKDHGVPNILETRYNIGSIGKTVTGVAVMQLVEQGKVELMAPVRRYLPDFPHGDAITIHHLLCHTSGLANYMAHPDYRGRMAQLREIADLLPLIYDQELVFDTPGEAFSYSNSGIVLLGAVIEKVSGKAYREYIHDHIFVPAGMRDTAINFWEAVVPDRAMGYTRGLAGDYRAAIFDVPPASADGGLETTVLDLLSFDRALHGELLLSEASKTLMFTPNLEQYGYCWRIADDGGRKSIGHTGGAPGVSASFMRYPDDDVTIIVLSNYSGGAAQPAKILEAIVFGEPWEPPRPPLELALYQAMRNEKIETSADVEALMERDGLTPSSSRPLNQLGYELLRTGRTDLAIAVFEANLRRFPEDPNCYDSLAEAFLVSGDREKAIGLYRKALEVDPDFESSQRMLERLTKEQ